MPPDKESNAIGRKSSKPLMEKRRRARINASLMQLKCLVMEATNKNTRNSKLEKADILEMTVKHLKGYYRSQTERLSNEGTESFIASQYRYGFNECINQVSHFFGETDDPNCETSYRLLNHLTTAYSNGKDPATKRHHPVTATPNPTPYPQPAQVHLQTRETHRQTTVTHRPVLQSVSGRLGSPPPTAAAPPIIGVISQPHQLAVPQQPIAAVNVARIVSGIPIGFTSSPGEVALVLPQHYVPSTELHTHLIPVYADGTSGMPSHYTSVRLPSSCSVFPILGNQDVSISGSRSAAAAVGVSSVDSSVVIPHNIIPIAPQPQRSSRRNSEVGNHVHEAADMLQVEDANDDLDEMWRPW